MGGLGSRLVRAPKSQCLEPLCESYLDSPTSCKRKNCKVQFRCIECHTNIVSHRFHVCDSCGTTKCDNCKQPTHKLFGNGLTGELVCASCTAKDDLRICSKCHIAKPNKYYLSEQDDICPACQIAGPSGQCEVCGFPVYPGESYNDDHCGFHASRSICHSCHKPRVLNHDGECYKCSGKKNYCRGCGFDFVPYDKGQKFCDVCLDRILKNLCTICGDLHNPTNIEYHCVHCTQYSTYSERKRCPECKIHFIKLYEDICDFCLLHL